MNANFYQHISSKARPRACPSHLSIGHDTFECWEGVGMNGRGFKGGWCQPVLRNGSEVARLEQRLGLPGPWREETILG